MNFRGYAERDYSEQRQRRRYGWGEEMFSGILLHLKRREFLRSIYTFILLQLFSPHILGSHYKAS